MGFCSILIGSGGFWEYLRISGNNNSFCVLLECKQLLHTLSVLQKGWDLELDGIFEKYILILILLELVGLALPTWVGKNQGWC